MRHKRPDHELAGLAGVIRAWRVRRGMNQTQLGKQSGWAAGAQISKYETGKQWPDDPSLDRIAEVLGVERDLLVEQALELAEKIERRAGRGDYPTGEEATDQPGWVGEGLRPEELRRRRRELLTERRDIEERLAQVDDQIHAAIVRMALEERGEEPS